MSLKDKLNNSPVKGTPLTGLTPLVPIKDFFAKMYLSYYPYELKQLIPLKIKTLPIMYLNRGIMDEEVTHLQSETEVLSGVCIDDWGEDIFRLNFSDIIGSFTRYEVEPVKSNIQSFFKGMAFDSFGGQYDGLKVQKGYVGMEEIVKKGLNRVTEHNNGSISYKKWSELTNSGENILRQLIMFYRHNGVLFDEDGIPVITGNIIIETNYAIVVPSLLYERIPDSLKSKMGGNLQALNERIEKYRETALDKYSGVSDLADVKYMDDRQFILNFKEFIRPLSIYKGKISSLSLDFSTPYSFSGTLEFSGIQRKYTIPAVSGKVFGKVISKSKEVEFIGNTEIVEGFGVQK